jgi:uncharacterized protein YegL
MVDTSESMSVDGKIQTLNTAVREAIPHLRAAAGENPEAEVIVHVLQFADRAAWVGEPEEVGKFEWQDLAAGGLRAIGDALAKAADQLKIPPMPQRGMPPVLVLMCDGQPTDDFAAGLRKLNREPWAKRAVRLAIAIGKDADVDALRQFTGPDYPVLAANNAEQLTEFIRWAPVGLGDVSATNRGQRKGVSDVNRDPFDIPVSRKPLHFFWIADTSGSMSVDGKIQTLNTAVREALPHMCAAAGENPEAEVIVHVLQFADRAAWVGEPEEVGKFEWQDLGAGGLTAMGDALGKLADQLKMPPMPQRGLPPVLAVVSDGQPNDDFEAGLERLNSEPWAKRAVRVAVAIGKDADVGVLRQFTGPEYPVLAANNAEQLTEFIRWASTEPVKSASSGSSGPPDEQTGSSPAAVHLTPADDPGGNEVY